MKKSFTYAVFTDVGDRKVNEDSVGTCTTETGDCFVLCDGLGGHGMGDEASRLVTTVFEKTFRESEQISDFQAHVFSAAQDILLAEQKRRNAEKKMKTTATVLASDRRKAYIGHIGDSRVYVFHHNKVRCRTLDHSIPQMLVMTGEIKEEEIRNHPDRNILLRVMGIRWDEPMYEWMRPIPLWKCQAFLLCSDGFWELIEEEQMCDLLKHSDSSQQWLDQMVQVVRANGADRDMDNFSAIAVWYG